jgi:hypothetical protein
MSEKTAANGYYTGHANSFAGIHGCMTATERPPFTATGLRSVTLPEGALLLEPSGRWALRLRHLPGDTAQMLLQVLRDLSPPATQIDSSFIRRVAAYDDACAHDPTLLNQISEGVCTLDALAIRITKRRYLELEERALRRTLLLQLTDSPLLDRLGARAPAYSSAAI